MLAAIALHNGAPPVVESAGFAPRVQTEADLEATRWGLVAWEDPRERSRFKPFWIDEKMLMAVVVEPGDPVGMMARETGMTVSGLRLLDGALVLKVKRGRRVEQIRVLEGDSTWNGPPSNCNFRSMGFRRRQRPGCETLLRS